MSISRDAWLKALGDAATPPDPAALTTAEITKEFGMSRASAYRCMLGLLAQGRAIRTTKEIEMLDGRRKRVVAYRLLDPPTRAETIAGHPKTQSRKPIIRSGARKVAVPGR